MKTNVWKYPALIWSWVRPTTRLQWLVTAVIVLLNLLFIGLFVGLSASLKYDITDSPLYMNRYIDFSEASYSGHFGYCLEIMLTTLFGYMAFAMKQQHWLAWSFTFFLIFLDDYFEFHEIVGMYLTQTMSFDMIYGELTGFAIHGFCSFLVLTAGFFVCQKDSPEQTSTYLLFVLYLVALVFFGVGVDAAHSYVNHHYIPVSETFMVLFEDGMEMIILSLMLLTATGFVQGQKSIAKVDSGAH